MSTENQFLQALRGVGSRDSTDALVALVVAGNTTVAGTIVIPAGSWLNAVAIETPTAISGSPTSSLVRVGTTLHGQDIVADVDAKAQGHIASTIVAAFDKIGGLAGLSTLFVEVTTAGGTSSAGTINIRSNYAPPV